MLVVRKVSIVATSSRAGRWSDNLEMSLFGCSTCNSFRSLSVAAAKSAASRLRQFGLKPVAENWTARATLCERCPLRVISRGVSYCGKPLLKQVTRDPASDGCGCPTREKSQVPDEHCPIDSHYAPARQSDGFCTCKWCTQAN